MSPNVRELNNSPDPDESIQHINRPAFIKIVSEVRAWLPDISGVLTTAEVILNATYELSPADCTAAPAQPAYEPTTPQIEAEKARELAKWAFNTYCKLVVKRITAYNHYRKKYNQGEGGDIPGQYRRAARLAIEQMLRRDLPYIGFDWNYYQPLLPVFDIDIKLVTEAAAGETHDMVLSMTIGGKVETLEHAARAHTPYYPSSSSGLGFQEDEWSSSSSSFSSSSTFFDPGT